MNNRLERPAVPVISLNILTTLLMT